MAQEKSFENKVKRFLESNGVYPFGTPSQDIAVPVVGYYEKRWGGGQFAKSGLPDLHVVIRGRSIESELKAPNGRPSVLQLKNLELINSSDSIGHILVESSATVERIKRHIQTNHPKFKDVPIVDFDEFKKIVNVFIKNA